MTRWQAGVIAPRVLAEMNGGQASRQLPSVGIPDPPARIHPAHDMHDRTDLQQAPLSITLCKRIVVFSKNLIPRDLAVLEQHVLQRLKVPSAPCMQTIGIDMDVAIGQDVMGPDQFPAYIFDKGRNFGATRIRARSESF
nr:hypothetical protein [Komagataeibacter sp. FNDCF1]